MKKRSSYKIEKRYDTINENISQAKSILKKLDIKEGSKEYEDYLKIRDICKNNLGYVGLLTRIRFLENITDLDEVLSVLDTLKDNGMDVGKLSKMSYEEILEEFWNDVNRFEKSDLKLVLDDGYYSYYEVSSYEAMLTIASPAWCLKTKSHWNRYDAKYEKHYVIIQNKYRGKLLTPANSNLFDSSYSNKDNYIVRFGVSMNKTFNDMAFFDDNNNSGCFGEKCHIESYVYLTCLNLINGINKPFYEYSPMYSNIKDSKWRKLENAKIFDKVYKYIIPDDHWNSKGDRFIYFGGPYQKRVYLITVHRDGPYLKVYDDFVHGQGNILSVEDGLVPIIEKKCKYFLPRNPDEYSLEFLDSLGLIFESKYWWVFLDEDPNDQTDRTIVLCRKKYDGKINLPTATDMVRKYGLPTCVSIKENGESIYDIKYIVDTGLPEIEDLNSIAKRIKEYNLEKRNNMELFRRVTEEQIGGKSLQSNIQKSEPQKPKSKFRKWFSWIFGQDRD